MSALPQVRELLLSTGYPPRLSSRGVLLVDDWRGSRDGVDEWMATLPHGRKGLLAWHGMHIELVLRCPHLDARA
jgi:hypothetical protein